MLEDFEIGDVVFTNSEDSIGVVTEVDFVLWIVHVRFMGETHSSVLDPENVFILHHDAPPCLCSVCND